MRRNRVVFVGIALAGVAAAGCDGFGGNNQKYVTRKEFEELRKQYIATHDTMLAFWKAADSTNRILQLFFAHKITPTGKFPTPPPPPCPPACIDSLPDRPGPIEQQ
jgi:hypothetical protein